MIDPLQRRSNNSCCCPENMIGGSSSANLNCVKYINRFVVLLSSSVLFQKFSVALYTLGVSLWYDSGTPRRTGRLLVALFWLLPRNRTRDLPDLEPRHNQRSTYKPPVVQITFGKMKVLSKKHFNINKRIPFYIAAPFLERLFPTPTVEFFTRTTTKIFQILNYFTTSLLIIKQRCPKMFSSCSDFPPIALFLAIKQ